MQKFFKSELGRSMVEMLGVLALVGVLSVAAVAGYSYAITKWKANETLSEIGQRAMEESLFLMKPSTNPVLGMQLPETDFGPTSSLGYAVSAFISDVNEDYFEIVLQNVPGAVCQQLIRDDEISIGIFVGETLASGEPSLCGTEETTPEMSFVFRADLSRFDNCSKKGYFDLTDLSCHCSGNTYIDSETNECLCPAGHVWSEDEKTCVESLCPENQYETVTNGCVPCSDQTPYKVSGAGATLCVSVCGEDNKMLYQGLCMDKNRCKWGEEVINHGGGCYPCTNKTLYIPYDSFAESMCKACKQTTGKDHHMTSLGVCVQTDDCIKGTSVRCQSSTGGDGGCCSCTGNNDLVIGGNGVVGPVEKEYCEACLNSAGQKNRKVEGIYCVKIVCDEGEFKGSDGKCYPCSKQGAVSIGTDAALIASCEAESCGREATADGLCQIKDCPEGTSVRLESGACYSCSQETGFNVGTVAADQAACLACSPARHLTSWNYCVLTGRCANVPIYNGAYCIECHDARALLIGTGPVEMKECNENCQGKRIALGSGYCALKSCAEKTQFMDAKGACHDCSYTASVKVGPDDYTQALCRACEQHPRFVINNICYRCDTDETPDVTTEAEKSACTLCTERTISADGKKCILKQ